MEPLINNGNEVVVSFIPYFFKKPKTGDIVAFKKKQEIFIKRVVKEKNGEYFVEGDNKKDSLDSRSFGSVKINDIIGKVIYIVK